MTSGSRRRLALAMALGFAVVLIAITVGNAESMISDFAAAGVPETDAHIWLWQVTSAIAWLSVTPAIWRGVASVRPPRFGWPAVTLILLLGGLAASAWHIGVMVALRTAAYAAEGATYRFQGNLANPFLYELRKDVGTYLQLVGLALLAQWLLARAAPANGEVVAAPPRLLHLGEGKVAHRVPVEEVEHVEAAGNYVEVWIGDRSVLHRATLASVEDDLGPGFARIHRSRVIRTGAVRRIETDRSGDFTVTLASGREVRGSRRYRDALCPDGVGEDATEALRISS